MNYNGKEDEVIESVNEICYQDDEAYIGICIKTNYDTYKFCIEKFSSCCELFGVSLRNEKNEVIFEVNNNEVMEFYELEDLDLEGKHLYKIEYCHEKSDNYTLSTKITFQYNHSPDFLIYYINIYNEHNGYYPHDYLVQWNGYKNEGRL